MDANGFTKMQEFARNNTTPPAPPREHWPTAEELAAYIDGTLSKAEAQRITQHLANCEDCYSVYAETLRFQLESEPAPTGNLVPFPSRRQTAMPWYAVAAAALLAVSLGLGWYLFQEALWGPLPRLQVAEVVPDVKSQLVPPTVFRSGDDGNADAELDPREPEKQSFRVGWLLVRFHVHAKADDLESASEDWRTLGRLCKKALMSEEADRFFAEANQMRSEASASPDLSAILPRAAEREALLADSSFFPEFVDFGKWTAAGQIAATARDRSFFDNPRNRRFLAHALRGRGIQPELEVVPELRAIARIWAQGELGAQQFAVLEGHFKAILGHYDFTS